MLAFAYLLETFLKLHRITLGIFHFLLFDSYTYYIIFSSNHSNFKNQRFYTKNMQIVSFCCILVFCFIKHSRHIYSVFTYFYLSSAFIHFQEQFQDKIKYILCFFTQMNSFSPSYEQLLLQSLLKCFLECTTQTVSVTSSPLLPSFIDYFLCYIESSVHKQSL